ncbi:hypothetical protein [Thermocrinis sp.]|uniref:hypothetical protein n=1 Tax=Thermocrinis sp. TaxID=2024383 RepID=UPI002FDD37FB
MSRIGTFSLIAFLSDWAGLFLHPTQFLPQELPCKVFRRAMAQVCKESSLFDESMR